MAAVYTMAASVEAAVGRNLDRGGGGAERTGRGRHASRVGSDWRPGLAVAEAGGTREGMGAAGGCA